PDPAAHKGWRRALLNGSTARADTAAPAARDRLWEIQHLVRPWLSLAALEQADRELLADLSARCRGLDDAISGWRAGVGRVPGLAWLLLAGLAVLPLLLAAGWSRPPLAETAPAALRGGRLRPEPAAYPGLLGGGGAVAGRGIRPDRPGPGRAPLGRR